jgi:ABC-type phosphate transport system substrate-binding protein
VRSFGATSRARHPFVALRSAGVDRALQRRCKIGVAARRTHAALLLDGIDRVCREPFDKSDSDVCMNGATTLHDALFHACWASLSPFIAARITNVEERMTFRKASMALVAGAIAVSATVAQAATTTCGGATMFKADGTTPFTATPIYITGSSAVEPMLKIMGAKLASQTTPYVLIYLKDGSCAGVNRIASDGMIANGTVMFYVPPDQDPTKASPNCTLAAAQLGDVVLADADATLCPGVSAQPTGTKDFNGPVNNMVLIVPSSSAQQAISAEAAYLVFGDGAAGMVTPWIDPTSYYIRTPDSGTRAMINANIGVAAHAWKGMDGTANGGTAYSSGSLFNAVVTAGATAADKTIGILGSDYLDQGTNRTKVKSLAFRAFGQHWAYWPDSSVTSYDKLNVREGRYAIWGYLHMLATVAAGVPTSVNAAYFINLIQGTLPAAPAFNVNDAITDSHYVPQCAMKVTHDIEGGALKAYKPTAPCGCYFDNRIAGAKPAACTACTTSTDCSTGQQCVANFCEAAN